MTKKTAEAQIKFTAKDKTKGVFSSVKSQLIGIGAAYLGFRAVSGILSSIVDKARDTEKAWNDVAASLKRHGHEVDNNVDKIKAFADEMQTLTGISDETIGKGIQGFLDYGLSVDEAFDTMQVAIDFAAGANMQLGSAVDLLQKAAVGYTGTLSRYGIIIDENIPKSEKFAAAVDQVNQRFGGAAQAQADTYAVKIAVMGQKWGDLQEKIGLLLLPTLIELTDVGSKAIDSFISVFDSGLKKVQKAIKTFDATSKSTLKLADRYDKLTAKTKLTNIEQKELNGILVTFQEQSPGVITAWDNMGVAVSANTTDLRNNLEAERSLIALRMEDVLKDIGESFGEVSQKIKQNIAFLKLTQKTMESGEPILDATRAGWQTVSEALVIHQGKLKELTFEAGAAFPELKEGTDRYAFAVRTLGQAFVDLLTKAKAASEGVIAETKAETKTRLQIQQAFLDRGLEMGNIARQTIEIADQESVELRKTARAAENVFLLESDANMLTEKLELIELGLSEEEAIRLIARELEVENATQLQDDLIELAYAATAVKLGITRAELDARLKAEGKYITDVEKFIGKHLDTISNDFKSMIQDFVRQTDSGAVSMRDVWKGLGDSIRSVFIDIALDALINFVKGIILTAIPAMVAEGVMVKVLTKKYIALAAAKSAASLGLSTGASVAGAAATLGSLTPMLLGFDDPLNDKSAIRHGRDYAKFFMEGAQDRFGSPRFGQDVSSSIATGIGEPEPSAAPSNITINFNAPVTNREFVETEVIPMIEDAVLQGRSQLAIDTNSITGLSPVR